MEKNTLLAIIISAIIIIAYMVIQPILFPLPEAPIPETPVVTEDPVETKDLSVVNENHNIFEEEELKEENYILTTNFVKIIFTNKGGDIISYELLEHKDKDGLIQMADNISENNRSFSVAFGDNYENINNVIFNTQVETDKIIFSKKLKNGGLISKTYSLKENEYMFKLDITVEGVDGGYTLRTSPQIGPHYNAKKDRYEYRRFLAYSNGKQKKKQLGNNATEYFEKEFTWTGVAGKYFSILVKPVRPQDFSKIAYSTAIENNDYANAQVMLLRKTLAQKLVTDEYYIYIGPQKDKILSLYNKEADNIWGVSGFYLDDALSYSGILSWLEAILKAILEFMHDKLKINWGIAIIIMTILLKIIMFPLTKKSSIATLKMQQIQPQIQELQAKYKNNPEKLNLETAKLYQEMGHNPLLSGCLPLLLQFPLIISMFNLFNNYFEFRGAKFIPGWIPDLSVGDSIMTLGFSLPILGNEIRLLPFIYVVFQLLYGKITQSANNANAGQMKFMTYGMPLIFFFLFYNAPAGLLIYWTVSHILQLGQQILINKMMKEKREEMGLSQK